MKPLETETLTKPLRNKIPDPLKKMVEDGIPEAKKVFKRQRRPLRHRFMKWTKLGILALIAFALGRRMRNGGS